MGTLSRFLIRFLISVKEVYWNKLCFGRKDRVFIHNFIMISPAQPVTEFICSEVYNELII